MKSTIYLLTDLRLCWWELLPCIFRDIRLVSAPLTCRHWPRRTYWAHVGRLSDWSSFSLLLGFALCCQCFPFHSWSPDGYAGAPTAVSMIHAGVLKNFQGYGLIRIKPWILPLGKFWAPVIAVLAVGNVLYAAFIALVQKDLKYVRSVIHRYHIWGMS